MERERRIPTWRVEREEEDSDMERERRIPTWRERGGFRHGE
jgi:hypothetical protein